VNHGVFATRSPGRPNGIGISVVKLCGIKANTVQVEDMDIVDGTPLLDIKPYVPEFDTRTGCCIGWMKDNVNKMPSMRDDGRFVS
jgi:tRNA (Thr-GGU) A37 N-methylase